MNELIRIFQHLRGGVRGMSDVETNGVRELNDDLQCVNLFQDHDLTDVEALISLSIELYPR